MILQRRGSHRDHGLKVRTLDFSDVTWDADTGRLWLTADQVSDFSNPGASHDYNLGFKPEELGYMIDAIALSAFEKSPNIVSSALSPSLRSLLRIIAYVCKW